jgi:predicted ArsR family transcriptional regulator
MRTTRWDKRFWASTRGRLILLLRPGNRTVHELATELGLTDNAVRTHLDRLERDGLIQASGIRPGIRKPMITYGLTLEAGRLFPRMYGPILHQVLEVLAETLPPKKLEEIARAVGHRLAAEHRSAVQAAKIEDRAAQAIMVLGDWGGACERGKRDGKLVIRCFDCPLAIAVVGHPEVCLLVETMLSDLLAAPVHQHCQMEPAPQCTFEIGTPKRKAPAISSSA